MATKTFSSHKEFTNTDVYIYGLVDPRTLLVRYIGLTSQGMKRVKKHGTPRELAAHTYKNHWIKELRAAGLEFQVVILQESAEADLSVNEQWWLLYGRASGWPLTNMSDGGDGPGTRRVFTPEWRAKISAYHKGRPKTLEQRRKMSEAALRSHASGLRKRRKDAR